ncbi:MAG: hypothetical protein PHP04_07665 [Bacteroidales bacterium]|nr:hypothetical protein [Bacteroidales bacterium]
MNNRLLERLQNFYLLLNTWMYPERINYLNELLSYLWKEYSLISDFQPIMHRAAFYLEVVERMLYESPLLGFIIYNFNYKEDIDSLMHPSILVDNKINMNTGTFIFENLKTKYKVEFLHSGSRGFSSLIKPGDIVHFGSPIGIGIFTLFPNQLFFKKTTHSYPDAFTQLNIEKWGFEILTKYKV